MSSHGAPRFVRVEDDGDFKPQRIVDREANGSRIGYAEPDRGVLSHWNWRNRLQEHLRKFVRWVALDAGPRHTSQYVSPSSRAERKTKLSETVTSRASGSAAPGLGALKKLTTCANFFHPVHGGAAPGQLLTWKTSSSSSARGLKSSLVCIRGAMYSHHRRQTSVSAMRSHSARSSTSA